jgi:predicted RNA-binding protein associated with RNAse of E/G family
VFRQQVVHASPACVVTYVEHADIASPVQVRGRAVLEPGAPAVWFTFPDAWFDVGLFHTRAGAFTGSYANILTPVRFISPLLWETTDLFLDVWHDDAGMTLLDEDELARALAAGAVTAQQAARARAEADRILALGAAGTWPPPICRVYTLARVRELLRIVQGTRAGDVV